MNKINNILRNKQEKPREHKGNHENIRESQRNHDRPNSETKQWNTRIHMKQHETNEEHKHNPIQININKENTTYKEPPNEHTRKQEKTISQTTTQE